MAVEVCKGVYWVGAVDWGIRKFHGYELSTHRGSSYNAYLVVDEKVALIDTVWEPFSDRLLDNIHEIIDPSKIDYIVANHAEMDHSGALPEVMRIATNATLITSKRGLESIPGHFHQNWNIRSVSNGERLSLGSSELLFIDAPMLHWPDSMFTYLSGRNILMPNDAFGQHYATAFRFNDEVDQEELYEEALKYYANILTPFSGLVLKKIDELLSSQLPIDVIAPSHGVIWRKDPLQIVKNYQEWARQIPQKRAVILYDTMWKATPRMAEAISSGLTDKGISNKLIHLAASDRNDVIVEVFKAKAVIIGSPTLNSGILPTVAPMLEDLRGLKFKNKVGAAFGSYGWSGEAVDKIEEVLSEARIKVAAKGIKAKWQPDEAALDRCRRLGEEVAEEMAK
jgi:flavorubredoxin